MSKRYIPPKLVPLATSVQEAWDRIDGTMTLGKLTLPALVADIDALRLIEKTLNERERDIIELRSQRDALQQSTWDKVKRVRAAVKGIYGDDSCQYQLVGGTRLSDRKSPRRTPVSQS